MDERYFFSPSADRLDRALVHYWLSELSYWAQGRTRDAQEAAMEASRNYGVYDATSGDQVAYGRVITDGVTFGWLCDVFVAPAVRGRGVGKMLTAGVMADLEPLNLRRVLLATGDAHGHYAQHGFAPLDRPDEMMARVQGRPASAR